MQQFDTMPASAAEKELIKRCLDGDRMAQKQLYDQYASGMYAVSLRYAKSDLEAEDILQDSFIKVFQNLKNFEGRSSLGSWIKRVVVNTALNSERGKRFMFPMVPVEQVERESDISLSGFDFEVLVGYIRELPEGCQSIFNLFAIEGYSHKEIAEMLKISTGTSKSQYARARKLLQERIIRSENVNYEQA
jgi:RNA polymerase sigma-70 factor (ECF subfamily)